MSVRLRAILLGAGFLVLVVAWFFLGFNPNRSRINELRDEQEEVEASITRLEAELARLEELQRMEPELRAQFTRLQDAVPEDPRIPDFILQVQEAANLAGIEFLSISPSLPAAFTPPGGEGGAANLQAIAVSIQTTGRFFALEDFIIRLEKLARAVRINTFGLSPGGGAADVPGTSPSMSVTFQLQIFMASTTGQAGGATGGTTGGATGGTTIATPAPETTPAPTPQPGG